MYIYIHNLVWHCLRDKELRTGKHHTFIYLAALRGQAGRPQHGTTFGLCPRGAWSDLGEVQRGFKESLQSLETMDAGIEKPGLVIVVITAFEVSSLIGLLNGQSFKLST